MDRKLIAILVVGLAVMGVTAWRILGTQSAEVPRGDRRYMHCPHCGREMRYDDARYQRECAYCGESGLVATTASIRETGVAASPVARLLPLVLIEATLLAAVVLWRLSRRARVSPADEELYMECIRCDQKLRYNVGKIGRLGKCPRCKRKFVFPAAGLDGHETQWWAPQWWGARK